MNATTTATRWTGALAMLACAAFPHAASADASASLALDTTLSTQNAVRFPDLGASAPRESARPPARPAVATNDLPDLRWDHVDGSARWTKAAMRALERHGQDLVGTVPDDIQAWCPAYAEADEWQRKSFWAGLLSALAKHESTYRPAAVGGGGLWYGLVQILPATARGYGCQARTGQALKDGALNMSCAVRILNVTVPRDNVVSRGMRGVAADWGPFHSSRKREDMRDWISAQPFCDAMQTSARPPMRPGTGIPVAGDGDLVPLFVSWELDKTILLRANAWGGVLDS
ncbi:transglycosylase SLT domain-containing protein [Jannaschia sp. LMIT008]|uniref:transglycosylase SLT domain-containing protein n=1 Tax=Jannaschia maritima TaxID=3032585 RepID=UPI0028128416|nr:transglycosylase SLT domain-containing protein [Jannaschia sp. LMIT008]